MTMRGVDSQSGLIAAGLGAILAIDGALVAPVRRIIKN